MQQEGIEEGVLATIYPGASTSTGATRRAVAVYVGELMLDAWHGTEIAPSCRPEGCSANMVSIHTKLATDDRTVLIYDQGKMLFVSELSETLRVYAVGLLESHRRRRVSARGSATDPA
jgi:hypothetical protein